RFLLTLWSALYLLINPLGLVGWWSPMDCPMHGGACTCPELCRQARERVAASAPTACPECQGPNSEVAGPKTDSGATTAGRCLLFGGCQSERAQAVTILGQPYLLSTLPVSTYIPGDQANPFEWIVASREGYSAPPFHPPQI